jgi:uncharacterized membrane protein YqjE
MANSPMTRTQFSSSLIAGAVAHTMFQTGWFGFGMSLAGLAAAALFGNLVDVIGDAIGSEALPSLFSSLGVGADILFWVLIAMLIGSLVLVLLAVIVSVWLLRLTGQRKPWAVTWASLGITAVLDIGLFWLYVWLATVVTDSPVAGPVLLTPVFALVGGILLGALVWWAIAHAYRDKTAEQQGSVSASGDGERGDADAAAAAPAPVTPADS